LFSYETHGRIAQEGRKCWNQAKTRQDKIATNVSKLRNRAFDLLTGPPALAFIPAFSLAAFWFGGEGALLVVAALVPAAYLISGGFGATVGHLKPNNLTKTD